MSLEESAKVAWRRGRRMSGVMECVDGEVFENCFFVISRQTEQGFWKYGNFLSSVA